MGIISDILSAKSCSLADYAVESPWVCLRDTVIYPAPAPQFWDNSLYLGDSEAEKSALLEALAAIGDSIDNNGELKGGMVQMMSSVPPGYSEFSALLALYSATGGNNWINNSGWIDADPSYPEDVTVWNPQVGTDGNGNITDILLAQNNLTGQIPTELSVFSSLQTLELERNSLTGSIPSSLGTLTNLTILNISENNLSGTLPSSFGNLTNLTYLRIYDNQFQGPIPFGPPSGSFYFDVSLNRFTFTDLLPFKNNFYNTSSYGIQDLVDATKSTNKLSGQTHVFTAEIDRGTSPKSEYQWFKNGVALNTRDTASHTLTVSGLGSGDSGDYYYKIWNSDLPGLELTSRLQSLSVMQTGGVWQCLDYGIADPSMGGAGIPLNPSMDVFVFTPDWEAVLDSCQADRAARASSLRELAVSAMLDRRMGDYYANFDRSCLELTEENLSYTYIPKEYHYTLYYYDQAGSLVQTIPPAGVQPLSEGQITSVKNGTAIHPYHRLETRYRYNSRNQLVWQDSPDGGESRFWYDRAGQLRLSRNAKQSTDDLYSYTRYDRQGRVTETGEITATESTEALQALLEDASFPDCGIYGCGDVTLTAYDRAGIPRDPTFSQDYLRSRVSWTAMVERDAVDTIFTYYSYDAHGNVKALLQDLPGIGSKRTEYVYDLVSGNVNQVHYQAGYPDQLIHRYRYDADNRLEEVHTSTDGLVWNRDASYYYYPHGPLARVELGEYNVQGDEPLRKCPVGIFRLGPGCRVGSRGRK